VATGGIVFEEKKRHGDITGTIQIACGQCTGCRMQRVADWQTRIIHESQGWKENCFITLTYGPGNLPPNSSLEHRDYQLFMKRLSKQEAQNGKRLRFFMCGEYGDENGRPHYHACIFNHEFQKDRERGKSRSGEMMYESHNLTELWGMGNCTTQDLTPGTAAYAAGYIMKKTLGEEGEQPYNIETPEGEILTRTPPYARMSNRPGLGEKWFQQNKTHVLAHDFIIQDGIKKSVPTYYTKLIKRTNLGTLPERTDIKRQEKSMLMNKRDQWPDRLAARETVHKAKIRTLKREL
jgi:hypothetical protein